MGILLVAVLVGVVLDAKQKSNQSLSLEQKTWPRIIYFIILENLGGNSSCCYSYITKIMSTPRVRLELKTWPWTGV